MKAYFSSNKPIGQFVFDEFVEISSDQDFIIQPKSNISPGNNSVALGESTSAYTDNSFAEGEYTAAGTRSFRIISGDIDALTWTLKTTEGIQPGMLYSVRLLNNYDIAGAVISVLDDHTISVDGFPKVARVSEKLSDLYLSAQPWYAALSASGIRAHPSPTRADEYISHTGDIYPPEYCFYDFDFDANTMWFVGHSEIGDISGYATGAHAEGYMTQAGKQYSHAEGVYSITAGKYSHAEGYSTIAVYSAHSEGRDTSAFGQQSHAEGNSTLTRGAASHASGVRADAFGDYSFAYNGDRRVRYQVKEEGQFGINPAEGTWGFYIGDTPFQQIIDDVSIDSTLVPKINEALSADGYEYRDISFSVISGQHINTNPDNNTGIGKPIGADTSSYVGEYCMIQVKSNEAYEISTRLGDRMCIMLFERPFVPLSSYGGYMILSDYQYKRFQVEIPDGCRYMTVDNYTKAVDEHLPISIKKKWPKYHNISGLENRITALEHEFSGVNEIVDSILNS